MALVDKNSIYDLVPESGPVGDMASLEGPAFANPIGSPGIHPLSLTNVYESSVHNLNYNPPQTDLDGESGPTFQVDSPDVTIQPSSLVNQYYSSVHSLNYTPSVQDLDGLPGPTFDNGLEPDGLLRDTIHENSLASKYFSTVHGITYFPTQYDRNNGFTPDQYIDDLPEGLGSLPG